MTFTHGLSTNNYGPRKLIVASSAANGTHTTLTSAMATASAGDTIELRDSVTENTTITPGVNITGPSSPGALNMPTITGTLTMSGEGTSTISNIILKTNSAPVITVSGSSASKLYLTNCFIETTNNTAISYTSSSSSSSITLFYCQANFTSSTGIAFYTMTSPGRLNIRHSSISNEAGTSTASDASAGIVQFFSSSCTIPLSTSSTGALNILDSCYIDTSVVNTTTLLFNGSGGGRCQGSTILSGSASAISVGTGASIIISQLSISSTNANAVTGDGTIIYSNIAMVNTSSTINTTTQTNRFSQLSQFRATGQPSFLAVLGTDDSNATGDGTSFTIGSGNALTEIFDQNGDFVTTGTFTAPITGRYLFAVGASFTNLGAGHTNGNMALVTSNRNYQGITLSPGAARSSSNFYGSSFSVIADMDAADTATFTINVSGSTKTVGVRGTATTTNYTWISGELIA